MLSLDDLHQDLLALEQKKTELLDQISRLEGAMALVRHQLSRLAARKSADDQGPECAQPAPEEPAVAA